MQERREPLLAPRYKDQVGAFEGGAQGQIPVQGPSLERCLRLSGVRCSLRGE